MRKDDSRRALQAIDLHFHDLGHEAGCRWLERAWPIHQVREMLGHANLSQTSTYLHASEMGLEASIQRFDAARGGRLATNAIKNTKKSRYTSTCRSRAPVAQLDRAPAF